jgi:colicin import membrane protein
MKLPKTLLAVALLIAVPASAQSLGELAKQEQARKKATPAAKKTYTNDDLKQVAPPSGTPGKPADDAAKPADAKAADAKASADPQKVADDKKPAEPAKDEAYWRARITMAREDIRRNEAFKEALQSRINALTADFAARDDPYQRAKVSDDRQKALAELGRVSDEIEKTKKQIADIEDEARRAGVPPGWLR